MYIIEQNLGRKILGGFSAFLSGENLSDKVLFTSLVNANFETFRHHCSQNEQLKRGAVELGYK